MLAARSPLVATTDADCVLPAYFQACAAGDSFRVYHSANVPKNIVDNQTINSKIFVTDVATINRAVTEGLKSPEAMERFAQIGGETQPTTPEQFGATIREETKRWGAVIQRANIKPE